MTNWPADHTGATVWIVLFLVVWAVGYRIGRWGKWPSLVSVGIIVLVALGAWAGAF